MSKKTITIISIVVAIIVIVIGIGIGIAKAGVVTNVSVVAPARSAVEMTAKLVRQNVVTQVQGVPVSAAVVMSVSEDLAPRFVAPSYSAVVDSAVHS